MRSSLLLLALTGLARVRGDAFDDLWKQYVQQTESAKQYETTTTRRERNLDHWDVPTAAAYLGLHPETLKPLPQYPSHSSSSDATSSSQSGGAELVDEYIGHDAAILFYAQWCNNCHAVAPSWDAIATHVNAGSRSSKLVMALFDCEKDTRHMELCVAAGVKAYPTMMFVGSGEYHDTDLITRSVVGKDKSAGPFGATTLRRTVKFQGNWQYGDQILDWVNIMRGLSSWHSMSESGPLRRLRNGIFGLLGRRGGGKKGSMAKDSGSLPVGVPPGFQPEIRAASVSSSGGDSMVNSKAMADLELKLNATKKEKELYEKAVSHSSYLLDGLLFPQDDGNTTGEHRDIFNILTNTDGWFKNATTVPAGAASDEHPSILRSCALELTIDYCSRITTRETNAYIAELNKIPEEDPFPTLDEIESQLMDNVRRHEPYCPLVESCMLTNFESAECRPEKCPFENKAACHYLETCLDSNIQNEYGFALGLLNEGETILGKDWGASPKKSSDESASKRTGSAGVGGWGVPVAGN